MNWQNKVKHHRGHRLTYTCDEIFELLGSTGELLILGLIDDRVHTLVKVSLSFSFPNFLCLPGYFELANSQT